MNRLPKPLRGKQFTYQEACAKGLSQYAIGKLIEIGGIERIEHGLYRSLGEDISDDECYRRAISTVGEPAVVCLLSALSHFDLTDTIPKQVWLMVPAEKRTKSSSVKLYRARDPRWTIGVVSKDGYSITSLERTIVDSMTRKALISPRFGIDAIKLAISTKKTTAHKILEMSNALGVKHRILPYIEALS